jgi:hypothetical protein
VSRVKGELRKEVEGEKRRKAESVIYSNNRLPIPDSQYSRKGIHIGL